MASIKWLDTNQIEITPPKRPKKCTGTRFGAILGVNRWNTPFNAWCAITRTYEEPFIETKYTNAGKIIEPKQADYMERSYGMTLVRPQDIYGEDFFHKTYGDFFPDNKTMGGMYDFLAKDENGNVDTVLEMKTTARAEDWKDNIPEYYALQAALYAWLLGVDNVIMVASFLEEKDYADPSKYVPNIENTITVEFKVSERYPDFAQKVAQVEEWWANHVDTGISPVYDEKKDAEILAALRTHNLTPDTDINTLISEAEGLKKEVDSIAASIADKEKRLKEINDIIKEHAQSQFRDGDKKVELKGSTFTWTVSRSETTTIDKKALEADGLLDKYQKKSEQYRMTIK